MNTRMNALVQQIIKGIQDKRFPGGRRLPPERELSAMLGVSRASLREALRVLEVLGIVETTRGGGTSVCAEPDFSVFLSLVTPLLFSWDGYELELVDLRIMLELAAVEEAAGKITRETSRYLREPVRIMRIAMERNDSAMSAAADLDFHQRIFRVAEKPVLHKASGLITSLLEISSRGARRSVMASAGDLRALFTQHNKILEAIIAGDKNGARDAMRCHLESVTLIYRQLSHHSPY